MTRPYCGDEWPHRDDRLFGQVPIDEMFAPVRCRHCRQVYDGGKVTVTARYADCSVWTSPCCGRTVDDRPAGWGGGIERLDGGAR